MLQSYLNRKAINIVNYYVQSFLMFVIFGFIALKFSQPKIGWLELFLESTLIGQVFQFI